MTGTSNGPRRGTLHHVELRVADLDRAVRTWGWLLGELGYEPYQRWDGGRSWTAGGTYVVLEAAPPTGAHDRCRPGLSHLAFHAGNATDVDRLWHAAPAHGWSPLSADRHPFAGGPDHHAAFLEDAERMKVELVASDRWHGDSSDARRASAATRADLGKSECDIADQNLRFWLLGFEHALQTSPQRCCSPRHRSHRAGRGRTPPRDHR